MNSIMYATYLGCKRQWIELKQTFRHPEDLAFNIFMTVLFLIVLFFQRDVIIEGTSISLAMATLASLFGMLVAIGGTMGTALTLAMEREDGTLLRAKATPQGMVGYLVSRFLGMFIYTIISLILLILPGLFMIDELLKTSFFDWLSLLGILVLGLLATIPWGAVIGSLVKNSASGFNRTFLLIGGVSSISGIFYPISALPTWIQGIAQIFPMYWLGLGMRSIFLPDVASVAEIDQSWRTLETLGILSIWAIIGFIIAPNFLRRMARHESGSTMETRKQEVLKRGY